MATTTLTFVSQKITAPDGNENDIDFDAVLSRMGDAKGWALCDNFSASTQLSVNGVAIDASTASFSSGNIILPIKKGTKIKYKTTNAATFNVTINP